MNAIGSPTAFSTLAGTPRRRTLSRRVTSTSGGPRCRSARPWRSRTTSSSRCPTPAPSSGTWRTRRWFFETFVLKPRGSPTTRGRPIRTTATCSTRTTTRSASGSPRPDRGLLSRPTVAEVYRYRAAIDERCASCSTGPTTRGCTARRDDRARAASRAAAPGADPDRPEARLRRATRSGRSTATSSGPAAEAAGADRAGSTTRPGSAGSGTTAPASRSTTNRPGTRSSSRPSAWPTGW